MGMRSSESDELAVKWTLNWPSGKQHRALYMAVASRRIRTLDSIGAAFCYYGNIVPTLHHTTNIRYSGV